MSMDAISALARALSFIALFQAAGVAITVAMFGRLFDRSAQPIQRVGFLSAVAGMVLVFAHYTLEAARMAGALSGVLDMSLQSLVLDSSMSVAAGLRLLGLVLIASSIRRGGAVAMLATTIGAVCIAVAFALVGHTADEDQPKWLAAPLIVHLLVVAFWFGGLAPLHIASRVEQGQRTAQIVAAFTRAASVLVPGLFLMGIVLTLALVDDWEVIRSGYGLLLIVKITGFALLMGLASLNKWRYGPAIATKPSAAVAFQRTVAIEYVLICTVLAATAAMTTFFSPSH